MALDIFGYIYPKIKKGLKNRVGEVPIKEGQVLATRDTFEIFVDIENTRMQLCIFDPDGGGDFVEWGDVNKTTKPFGKIPFVGEDGVIELGKYVDFHQDNTGTKDYDVRITCKDTGLHITGKTEGGFKGDLEGNADSATISDKVKDSGDGRELTMNYSGDGLESCDWLAAWNGNELRAISSSKFLLNVANSASDLEEGETTSRQVHLTYLASTMYDCWEEAATVGIYEPYYNTDTLKDTNAGDFPRIPDTYLNHSNIFLVMITCSSSSENSAGADDQGVMYAVYYRYASSKASYVGSWKAMTLGSFNNRGNDSEGNQLGYRFSFKTLNDWDGFFFRVNKGAFVWIKCWVL